MPSPLVTLLTLAAIALAPLAVPRAVLTGPSVPAESDREAARLGPEAEGALTIEPALVALPADVPEVEMATVRGGTFRPLYRTATGEAEVEVADFRLAVRPLTNADYLAFAEANPDWRRSAVRPLFAEDGYLAHWAGDLDLGTAPPNAPVVNVSWFAARAYAAWAGPGSRRPTSGSSRPPPAPRGPTAGTTPPGARRSSSGTRARRRARSRTSDSASRTCGASATSTGSCGSGPTTSRARS